MEQSNLISFPGRDYGKGEGVITVRLNYENELMKYEVSGACDTKEGRQKVADCLNLVIKGLLK